MVTLENNTREVGSFLLLVLLPKGLVLWSDKFPKCTKQSLETNGGTFQRDINSFFSQESHLLPGNTDLGWSSHTKVLRDTLILTINQNLPSAAFLWSRSLNFHFDNVSQVVYFPAPILNYFYSIKSEGVQHKVLDG